VAGSPNDRRSLQQFGRDTLAECLRLLDDPRLAAALPALTAAATQSALAPAATEGEPRPRRRRRTRAQIEADAAAAAAATPPATEEEPRRRRGGRRPRQEPAPVEAIVAAEEAPQPRRRGGRPRQQPGTPGNGSGPAALPPAAVTAPAGERSARSAGGRLNLNTSTRGELMRLPRIGALAADRIVEFREQQGRITGARQLRQAEVVSAAAWKQIRDQVRF
jgi:DNA uptake protein ComE-like DNA-binding protein